MNNNFSDMDRVNRIWRHPVYQEHYKKIQELESERIFCRHTPEHFLDVARLMYIYALEKHLELPKELIYAAALLHDIGRAQQYQYNIPHDIAGVEIAREILTDLHFTEQEKELILSSIGHHRKGDSCSWQHFFIKRISSPEIVFYVPLLLNAIGLMIKKI